MFRRNPFMSLLGVLIVSAAIALGTHPVHAQGGDSNDQSWTEKITSPFKAGFDSLGQALTSKPSPPKPEPLDDAISLKSKAKPGPDLYVAVAKLYARAGKFAEAEAKYQMALKETPNHLGALLGYAHMKELENQPDKAVGIYEQAAKLHPEEASVYNNLGLCHARQNRMDEAAVALNRAIRLDPKNTRYRNNIAAVLIDQNKTREAFGHLKEVHDTAAAHYNMGYLLNKKKQTQAALQHFSLALQSDPSMAAAQRWVVYLKKAVARERLAKHPASAGVKIADEPVKRTGNAPWPPERRTPQRLPSPPSAERQTDGPTLPGISYHRNTTPIAPLPPVTPRAALRPLPRVR